MSDTEENIAAIRQSIAEQQYFVDMGDAITRLQQNADFRMVIINRFIEKETLRTAMGAGNSVFDAKQQADLASMSLAGGHLFRFLDMAERQARNARDTITRLEGDLDEILNGPSDIDDTEEYEVEAE